MKREGTQGFSYPEVGATDPARLATLPSRYVVDHHRVQLGSGARTFERARAALHRWEMFSLPWVELLWPATTVAVGSTVGVLVGSYGIWLMSCCKVVYVLDESGEVDRQGFAYGTLPDHVESGEERFSVEWDHRDNSVWYDLLAFSRPNRWLAKVGHAYARRLQKRFALGSLAAMRRATNGG